MIQKGCCDHYLILSRGLETGHVRDQQRHSYLIKRTNLLKPPRLRNKKRRSMISEVQVMKQ